jgi:hypothetical protein
MARAGGERAEVDADARSSEASRRVGAGGARRLSGSRGRLLVDEPIDLPDGCEVAVLSTSLVISGNTCSAARWPSAIDVHLRLLPVRTATSVPFARYARTFVQAAPGISVDSWAPSGNSRWRCRSSPTVERRHRTATRQPFQIADFRLASRLQVQGGESGTSTKETGGQLWNACW